MTKPAKHPTFHQPSSYRQIALLTVISHSIDGISDADVDPD
jgi:hypothetical protein